MSMHALKRPLALEWPAERLDNLPKALEQLHHWAQFTPIRAPVFDTLLMPAKQTLRSRCRALVA